MIKALYHAAAAVTGFFGTSPQAAAPKLPHALFGLQHENAFLSEVPMGRLVEDSRLLATLYVERARARDGKQVLAAPATLGGYVGEMIRRIEENGAATDAGYVNVTDRSDSTQSEGIRNVIAAREMLERITAAPADDMVAACRAILSPHAPRRFTSIFANPFPALEERTAQSMIDDSARVLRALSNGPRPVPAQP